MKTLTIILSLFAGTAMAGETVIQLHGLSYHADREADYNETNSGLAVRHYGESSLIDYVSVGQYKNSIYKTSRYVIAGWEKPINTVLTIGLVAGVVDGYKENMVPMIAPVISLWGRVHIFSAIIPVPVIEVSVDIARF